MSAKGWAIMGVNLLVRPVWWLVTFGGLLGGGRGRRDGEDEDEPRHGISPVALATIFAVLVGIWILSGQFGSAPEEQADAGAADSAASAQADMAPGTDGNTDAGTDAGGDAGANSGTGSGPDSGPNSGANSGTGESEATRVRVREIEAKPYTARILIIGHTAPNRQVQIRSEVEGTISDILVRQGARIKAGETAILVDVDEMPARLAEADARVEQREIEYAAARKLANKGFQAETKRAAAFANLRAAIASQEQIRIHLEGAAIKAPFDGILNRRYVELGDYLKGGDRVGEVVDLDPLVITAFVSERDYFSLAVGRVAEGRLSDGTAMEGSIRYISAAAEPDTRTFRVELEIPNPDFAIASGITAEMSIPKPVEQAHILAPSLFSLNEDGALGVKVVTADNRAQFIPISIIGIVGKDAAVTGLPDRVTLITVGQDFVADGEPVSPVSEDDIPGKNT